MKKKVGVKVKARNIRRCDRVDGAGGFFNNIRKSNGIRCFVDPWDYRAQL